MSISKFTMGLFWWW